MYMCVHYIYICTHIHSYVGIPRELSGKESTCSAGDVGSITRLGKSPEEENGNPFQCFCWEIPWIEEPGGV